MPRPSSSTLTEPSACSVTLIFLPCPASASSAALSSTSWMMCSGLSVRVYMPGRCLTGSSPLRTRMEPSEYVEGVLAMGADCRRVAGKPLDAHTDGARPQRRRNNPGHHYPPPPAAMPLQHRSLRRLLLATALLIGLPLQAQVSGATVPTHKGWTLQQWQALLVEARHRAGIYGYEYRSMTFPTEDQ